MVESVVTAMPPPALVVACTPSPLVALMAPVLVAPMVMFPAAPTASIPVPLAETPVTPEVTPLVSMAIVPLPTADACTPTPCEEIAPVVSSTTTLPFRPEALALMAILLLVFPVMTPDR